MRPRRVLMTTDAVGGVWRYSLDLCRGLNARGIRVVLVCVGPTPKPHQMAEVTALPGSRLVCLDEKLDWLASGPAELARLPQRLEELAEREEVDLLHLNSPSQAAGLRTTRPVVVVSHSCVVTWWQTMRGTALPADWAWQFEMNLRGLRQADAVVAPSASHAEALRRAYGGLDRMHVVPNATADSGSGPASLAGRQRFVFAAARWWDEAKNAGVLDSLAARLDWPVRAAGACRGENGQAVTFSHVEALGALTHEDTRRLMREAGIFVSPSRYEPFGLAALEAASAGAALVLADIPTYREIWQGAAIFADPLDAAGFASAINRLAHDEAERLRWAERVGQRAATFTQERQIRALLTTYQAAVTTALEQSPAE